VKIILENFRKYLRAQLMELNKEEVIEIIKNNSNYEIYLDNPKGTTKKFGGLEPKILPFDYGEWPDLINPADNMGWDLIIVPSSTKNDENLTPVGVVDYLADPEIWKKVGKKMKNDVAANSKIIIAPDGEYSQEDIQIIDDFFDSLIQFKPVSWF
jgi:hypothetical protein